MSDSNDNEQGEQEHDDQCDQPGCLYHRLMSARIRAVTESNEIYVNVHDLAIFMAVWHSYGLLLVGQEAIENIKPDDVASQREIQLAIANQTEAGKMLTEMVHGLGHDTIKPLADLEGTLVSPEEMRNVPDTIPTDWLHEKESQ